MEDLHSKIDMQLWKQIQDKFASSIGLYVCTIDPAGNEVLSSNKLPLFCQMARPKISKYCNQSLVEQFKKLESRKIMKDIDYNSIQGLRIEARQKLSQIRPESIGQASRITGVSPADISVLLIYMEQARHNGNKNG